MKNIKRIVSLILFSLIVFSRANTYADDINVSIDIEETGELIINEEESSKNDLEDLDTSIDKKEDVSGWVQEDSKMKVYLKTMMKVLDIL